jgi:hypothetical protein
MLRFATLSLILAVLAAQVQTFAAAQDADNGPPLEEDLKKLEGKWSNGDKQLPKWTVTFEILRKDGKIIGQKATWSIVTKVKGQDLNHDSVSEFKLNEANKKRVIMPAELSTLLGLPKTVGYRFEGEALILTPGKSVLELQGEYKLGRVKK